MQTNNGALWDAIGEYAETHHEFMSAPTQALDKAIRAGESLHVAHEAARAVLETMIGKRNDASGEADSSSAAPSEHVSAYERLDPANPYKNGLPAENWQRGYQGARFIGYKGSTAEKFYLEGVAARKALAAPAPTGESLSALPFAILDDEIAALRRFHECATDGEGYDVPDTMMSRLAEIGLLHRPKASRTYYEQTDFGLSVLNGDFAALATPRQTEDGGLSAAKEAMERAKKLPVWDEMRHPLHIELAVIFKYLDATLAPKDPAAQGGVPEAKSNGPLSGHEDVAYVEGWNACRDAMLAAAPTGASK